VDGDGDTEPVTLTVELSVTLCEPEPHDVGDIVAESDAEVVTLTVAVEHELADDVRQSDGDGDIDAELVPHIVELSVTLCVPDPQDDAVGVNEKDAEAVTLSVAVEHGLADDERQSDGDGDIDAELVPHIVELDDTLSVPETHTVDVDEGQPDTDAVRLDDGVAQCVDDTVAQSVVEGDCDTEPVAQTLELNVALCEPEPHVVTVTVA